MPTPMLAPSVGVRCSATVTPSPLDADPDELGVGLGDGVPLPDALGVGSTVGPGDEAGGRPTDGVTATSTTRGERPPETPATGADGVGFDPTDGVGPGTAGDDDTTGGAAPSTEWPPLLSISALYASNAAPSPATA